MERPPADLLQTKPARRRRSIRIALLLSGILVAYAAVAYLALPSFWLFDERGRNAASDFLTKTPDGIPGDPINIALVGAPESVLRAFAIADWNAADPITLRTSVDIGVDVILDRPYRDAPISTLMFEGRRQDLAFEKPSGKSPDTRHHLRLWRLSSANGSDSGVWYGAASYDSGVGVSRFTGEITHHIGSDLDAERAFVVSDLERAGVVASTGLIDGVGPVRNGINGGGDRYFTDGKIARIVLAQSP